MNSGYGNVAYNFLFATTLTLLAVQFSLMLKSRGHRVWQDHLRLFAWKRDSVSDSAWYNTWPLSIILPRFDILEDLGREEA